MKLTDKITITNEDNMELMKRYPDNYFELAIVDPPYGIGMAKGVEVGKWKRNIHKNKDWDNEIPTKKYFDELFRISKNQIVWGGNYFIKYLTNTRCMIFWDKKNGSNFMSDGELAWTSFGSSVRRYTYNHIQEYNKGIERIHPTQKPIQLYEWILDNYAKEGDKILDTHLGSGSIAIACHNRKFELTACELDKDYFEASIKRIQNHINQLTIFDLGA